MIPWKKKGLVYSPPNDGSWRDNSALTPTPLLLDPETIRIFASFRDPTGVGRIGYIDLDAQNPSRIKKISPNPVLDIGSDGMFDDNGLILGDIVQRGGVLYMYYVGFQRVQKAKFLAFTGLAISEDRGESFQRYAATPILDRASEGPFIRAIHSVMYDDNKFKVWYATGRGWQEINGTKYPKYDICYTESDDGINFKDTGVKCITVNTQNQEYRIGRPRVYKLNGRYVMNFTYGTLDGKYLAGQAMSNDGICWVRNDKELGITPSQSGWDSLHLSYPAILTINEKMFMFYNGNHMGRDGFGFAVSRI